MWKVFFFTKKPGRGCCDFNYDLYTRIVPKPPPKPKVPTTVDGSKSLSGKKKLKSGKFDKKKGKRDRSKSPPKKKKNWSENLRFVIII